MDSLNLERRGLFDGLKVPALDLNAIFLAFIALIAFQLGVEVIAAASSTTLGADALGGSEALPLTSIMLGNLLSYFGTTGRIIAETFSLPTRHQPLGLLTVVAFFTWTTLIWSVFAASLSRIAAMRIAREDGLSLAEALGFGLEKAGSNLLMILGLGFFIGVLYVGTNATVAGWIGRIPYLGDVLLGLLFFLVIASSAAIIFVLTLGVLGFNLAAAAIATERSDPFDGISRSWNYILSQPWTFFLTNALILIFLVVFLTFSGLFLKVSVASLSVGDWGLGRETRIIPAAEAGAWLGESLSEVKLGDRDLHLPGRAEYLYNRVIDKRPEFVGVTRTVETKDGTSRRFHEHYLYNQGGGLVIDVLPAIRNDGLFYYTVEAIGYWILALKLLLYAYALNYFFAGQTTVYFLLRRAVDGDDYSEIIMGDEDGDELFDLPSYPSQPPHGRGEGGDGKKSLPMVMEV